MKKIFVIILVFLSMACFIVGSNINKKVPSSYSSLYEIYPVFKYERSVVRIIYNRKFICSGFAINNDIVVTAKHCVPFREKHYSVSIMKNGKTLGVSSKFKRSGKSDVAIIYVKTNLDIKPSLNCNEGIVVPSSYYIVGYPRGVFTPTFKSIFNLVVGDAISVYHLWMFGILDFGSSGSLVIDAEGNIIGVATSILNSYAGYMAGITTKKGLCELIKEVK